MLQCKKPFLLSAAYLNIFDSKFLSLCPFQRSILHFDADSQLHVACACACACMCACACCVRVRAVCVCMLCACMLMLTHSNLCVSVRPSSSTLNLLSIISAYFFFFFFFFLVTSFTTCLLIVILSLQATCWDCVFTSVHARKGFTQKL